MNFGEAAAKGRNVLSGHINVGEHHVHLHRAGSNTNDFFYYQGINMFLVCFDKINYEAIFET